MLFLLLAAGSATAQGNSTALPDKQQIEYYRDYAVITTNCQTWDEAYALSKRIVAEGGVVSTLLSPQRFLGWVPAAARERVDRLDRVSSIRSTVSMQKEAVSGPDAEAVQAGLEYFTNAKMGLLASAVAEDRSETRTPASNCLSASDDKGLPAFLSKLGTLSDSAAQAQNVPTAVWQGRMKDSLQSLLGIPRGIFTGVIAVEMFMLESTGAGATNNWTPAQELAQIGQAFRMFDFWSRRAAEYGHALSFRGIWYRPSTTSVVRVTGEPIAMVKEDDWRLVKQVMENLGYNNPFGDPGWGAVGAFFSFGTCLPCDLAVAFAIYPNSVEKEMVRVMKWNDRRREELRVDQSFCLFIKLQPPGTDHRAYARSIGTGYVGGRVYIPELHFSLDLPDIVIGTYSVLGSQEGAPIIAHETGHLFGAPDEYRENAGDHDCPQPGYWFRGTPNRNCIVTNPHSVRALMRNNTEINFTNNELSGATAVFVGWTRPGIHAPTTFTTTPAGIPITMDVGFESGPTFIGPRQIEIAQGFTIPSVSVPPFIDISGTRYYFEAWYERARGVSGTRTRTTWGATRSVRRDSLVVEYEARYNTTGGGITLANNTLEARLGVKGATPGTNTRQYRPGVVLVWRNTLTESGGSYAVQQRSGTDTWTDVSGFYFSGSAAPGYWYADLTTTTYADVGPHTFRIVPMTRAGARGTPSNEVNITLRSALPPSGAYCYDGNEPNNAASAATAIAFTGADATRSIDAAIPYTAQAEFGYSFDIDYYSLAASALGTSNLRVTIVPKQGSIFEPYVTYKPTPTSAPIEARRSASGGWFFDVVAEGNTAFSVTARRGSSDLVNLATGIGNWGEYTITIATVPPLISGLDHLCPECRSIGRIPAGGGRIYPFGTEIHAQRLFTTNGFSVTGPIPFGFFAEADPGFEFKGWEGDFTGTKNPDTRSMNPQNDPAGERMLIGKFAPIPQGQYELVYDVPDAWKSVLGPSKRTRGAMGDEIDIELPQAAMNGFDFLGWDGNLINTDLVSQGEWRYSPRIRVKLTRHLHVKPIIVPRPCTSGSPQAFTFNLAAMSAKSDSGSLSFGMQPGAGDGLESGQLELPPAPPTTVFDARFRNIDGAPQGSRTDIRAVKASHTYTGRVQPGDAGNPVRFIWDPIPASLPGTFLLTVGSTMVNMRSTTTLSVDMGTASNFSIDVAQDTCRELPRTEISVAISDVDASNFPFIRGRACITDKQGNPIMTVRPSDVLMLEKKGGKRAPALLRSFRPVDECYLFEGFIDNSTPIDNANKQRGIILVVGLSVPSGQDEKEATFNLPVPDPGSETGNGNGKSNTAYKVQHGDGWQLVSMPVMLMDSRVNAVFGDGSVRSALFGFNADLGYQTTDALSFGKGYWLRFGGTGGGSVNGTERTIFEMSGLPGVGQSAADGWNLIGGISYNVPLSSVTQTPANAILSLFEFSNGYKPATVLKPGLGYWVKLQPNATLRLVKPFAGNGGGGASKVAESSTLHDRVIASLPRSAAITASDANGGRADLFFTQSSMLDALGIDERLAAELPPVPPSTAFDARFATNLEVAAANGDATIHLQGTAPWTLAFEATSMAGYGYDVLSSDGAFLASIDLRSGGVVRVPQPSSGSNATRVVLRKSTPSASAPSAFVLGQNYPNPFSASAAAGAGATVLSYDIASEAAVEIAVFDALGRRVRTLLREHRMPGSYTAAWDGRDERGQTVSAGTYLYELRAGAVRRTKYMIVVK